MKRRILCLALAMLLALGGCLTLADEVELLEGEIGDIPEQTELMPCEGAEDEMPQEVQALEFNAEDVVQQPEDGGDAQQLEEGGMKDPVAPTALILPEKVTIGVGETMQLRPEAEPAEAVYSLTFSGGGDFATVAEDGTVTGVKAGEDTAVATADNGVSASVQVVVKAAPKKLDIVAETKYLSIGESMQLTCKLSKGAAGACTFSAPQNDVLVVTPEGVVTAMSPGAVKVTATAYNGVKNTVKLTVLPPFYVTFMDIGRNDGILIQCDGEYAFIDSGTHGRGVKAAKYMKKHGVTHLKYYIGTHAHKDHVGGAPAILAAIKTDTVIVSHKGTKSNIKKFAKGSAEKKVAKNASYRVVTRGETFSLGSAEFLVIAPVKVKNVKTGSTAENNNSLVLRLTYGENTFLLTGDATGAELSAANKAESGCLKAQVLKNPHHNGDLKFIIKKAKPEYTIFSTDKKHLPSSSFLRFVKKQGSKVYITASNRDGDVTFTSDGKKLKVTTEK